MKVLLTTIFAIIGLYVNAQVILINESFDDSAFPPNGWTVDAHDVNWSFSNSLNAGGSQGEATLGGLPDFYGSSRFISPAVDISNLSNLTLEFRHNVFFSSSLPGTGVIGVAIRSGNGDWNSIWEVNVEKSIFPEIVNIPIENSDTSASDFQFCFYFSGFSYILDWYIDDIVLESHFSHDVASVEVLGDKILSPNSDYQPIAVVKNTGVNAESFDIKCSIKDINDVVLFENTRTLIYLKPNQTDTLTFNNYKLVLPNALYKVEITTILSRDQDIDNNTVQKYIYTYTHDRNQVLLEIGTGTWCHFCIGAAMGANELIAKDKDVAVIEYHIDDSFTTSTGVDRINYYGEFGYPSALFDGLAKYLGGSENSLYDDYLQIYETGIDVKTGVDIDISQTFSNNEYTVNVELNKVGPIADDNLAVYLVLTESDITFSWQGLPKLNFVQRLTLPDAAGQSVDLVNNTNLSIPFTFQTDDSWTNDLELIAFVQNKKTKEVLNTAKVQLSNSTGLEKVKVLNNVKIYPNPASNWLYISDKDNTIKKVMIKDIAGKNILQINDFKNKRQIDISALEKGIYFIEMISNDNKLLIKKLIKI